ncbi:MAG: hypothetical protein HY271_07830 [Deltaproteobacteria bacterium]|nr:hypothetical protein [Deltaproteobacteria bacterium]
MTDTSNEVTQLYRDLLMRRSGAERLEMGCRMFDTARAFVRASLGDPSGTDRSREMTARLFLRTYGADFDPMIRDRIAAWLRDPGGDGRRRDDGR